MMTLGEHFIDFSFFCGSYLELSYDEGRLVGVCRDSLTAIFI
jgi:hypothetical protein